MAFTPAMIARLEAQRAYFASDEHLRERAAVMASAPPEECLAMVDALCRDAAAMLARLGPEELERALTPEPVPAETAELLAAIWQQRAR